MELVKGRKDRQGGFRRSRFWLHFCWTLCFCFWNGGIWYDTYIRYDAAFWSSSTTQFGLSLINLVIILYTCKYLTASVLLVMGGGLYMAISLAKRAILSYRHLYRNVIPTYAPIMFSSHPSIDIALCQPTAPRVTVVSCYAFHSRSGSIYSYFYAGEKPAH